MEASVLHCPACGAPAAADDTVCRYCEAPLATVACPKCFGLAFKGAKNCPHCGAALAAPVAVKDGQACPGCKRPMGLRELGGYQLEVCGGCAGIWIARAAFEALCQDKEKQAVVVEALPGSGASPVSALNQSYRPCPDCGKLMNRVNFAQISGVILDSCKDHGTFFDPDELRRLVAFLQGGGMDRARTRQMDALKEERRRLEAQAASTAGGGGMADAVPGGFATPLGGTLGGVVERGLTRFLFDLFLR